jgi:hypothetical protein
MSPEGDLPSAGHPSPRQAASLRLTVTDAERLIAGHWAHPEAAVEQHLLAALFDSATASATDQELAGEVAAVAAFMLGGERTAHPARSRLGAGRRTRVIAAGIMAASVVGFSGAAAADALPAPVQELAHQTFGAPAPQLPSTSAPASGQPTPVPGGNHHGRAGEPKTKAEPARGAGNGKGKANGNGKGNGNGNEGVPPGLQKKSASPSLTAGRKNQVAPHRTSGGGRRDGHATRSPGAARGSGSHEPRSADYPSRGSGDGHR